MSEVPPLTTPAMTHATDDPKEHVAETASRGWVVATLALTGVAFVLLFAMVPHGVYGDGYVRFLKLDGLLRTGTVGGERYSYLGPLFASPLWVFGDSRIWWVARFNVLVLAAGAVTAWWGLRQAVTPAERASAVLLLAASGMMPSATRDFYGELFSSVLVGTGLLLIGTMDRRRGWVAVVIGVVNTPAWGAGLLLVAIWRIWKNRRFDGLVALTLAASLIVLENTIVRDAPLDFGYQGDRGYVTLLPFSGMPGFSYPFLFGLLSQLFSFGKGLLFFAPGLLLVAHARRARPQLASFLDLSIAFLAGMVLVYSRWWAWYGGWAWGPRYLLFAVYPSSIALAISLGTPSTWPRSLAIVVITGWTVWVGVSGAVFGIDGLDTCTANGYALEHLCWYVPDYSPVLRPLILLPGPLAVWQLCWMLFAASVLAVLITSGPSLTRIGHELRTSVRLKRPRD